MRVLWILGCVVSLAWLPAAADPASERRVNRALQGMADRGPERQRLQLPKAQHGAKTWVSAEMHSTVTVLRILNPGKQTAMLKIHMRKLDGSRRALPKQMSLKPGETGVESFINGYSGSMVIASDQPVLVFGRIRGYDKEEQVERSMMSMRFVPIDCDQDTGVEWVCGFKP